MTSAAGASRGQRGRRGRGARRGGRGDGGPVLTTIWWRDIPVQVMATAGGQRVRVELPNRFTVAADAAAMEAGLAGSDDYLTQWDRRSRRCGPELADEVEAETARLVDAHPQPVLQALVRAGGRTSDAAPPPDPTVPSTAPTQGP